MDLAQGRNRVFQMVDHQGHHRPVERGVVKPSQRALHIVDTQVRTVPDPLPGQLDQLGTVVEAGHECTPSGQLLCIQPGPAADVQDSEAGDVPQDIQHSWPVIVAIANLYLQ